MRPVRIVSIAWLVLALAASGCAKKTETLSESAGDSLLSANPVETPEGSMTPSEEYQQPPTNEQNPPAPVTTRKPSTTRPASSSPRTTAPPSNPGVTVPAGTAMAISVDAQISTETAQVGDAWSGKVTQPVVVGTSAPIPAGSIVHGVVNAAKPAQSGDRAMLQLAVTSIEVDGKTHMIRASGEEIVAGSTRARNLGAVAGSAAAGALIGKAVGGSGKGALIGGLIGGAAATGAVAKSKGYQVVVKEGSEISFTVDQATTMKH